MIIPAWLNNSGGMNTRGLFLFTFPSFIFFALFCYIWARLTYRFYLYDLTEQGFQKEYGVIYKKYVTIPYDRIQNIDINRGILDRILGLSRIQIHTAGVGGVALAEGRLPGLSKEVANQIRDELLARAKQFRGQGL